MARWEFKLPDIGEGVTEGEVVSWLVKPGDVVKEDQPMVEIMTDKATVTITAPKAGTIVEASGKVGELVKVHSVLVVFDLAGGVPSSSVLAPKSEPAATAVGDIREELPGTVPRAPKSSPSVQLSLADAGAGYFNDKPLATPATRKLARDLNVDLNRVKPSGAQGRVLKDDVERFAQAPVATKNGSSQAANPGAPSTNGSTPSASAHAVPLREPTRIASVQGATGLLEERVPFAGMRRKIATKMAQSTHTAAHFTFVEECDVGKLKELRARLKSPAEVQGVKLSFLPFIVKAVIAALKAHPVLNSALDETTNEIVYRKYYNIGIATSTDAGLMVPVVKDCDRRSILDIAREIERVATEAKAGKSKIEDLGGSTFTVTSLGAQGGLFATPIINFPEVGILGVHQIKQRPVIRDGQIAIGEVLLLSLSFDHRIVDGHVGAAFAYDIIGYLENPDRLFLEMA